MYVRACLTSCLRAYMFVCQRGECLCVRARFVCIHLRVCVLTVCVCACARARAFSLLRFCLPWIEISKHVANKQERKETETLETVEL